MTRHLVLVSPIQPITVAHRDTYLILIMDNAVMLNIHDVRGIMNMILMLDVVYAKLTLALWGHLTTGQHVSAMLSTTTVLEELITTGVADHAFA